MKKKVVFYTSINRNYLANARVLAKSVKDVFPDCTFVLLFNDVTPAGLRWHEEPFDDVVFAHELGIPDFLRFAFGYSVVEFCTATKGVMLQRIFEWYDCGVGVYIDPDCVAFSAFDEVFSLLSSDASVVLTPHLTDPEDSEKGIEYHEIAALKHGTFNLGFIAVNNDARGLRFLDWWADRLIRHSHIDFESGTFTDQKWCNLAPYLFEGVAVLTDRAYNVATWNQKGRRLTRDAQGAWRINDKPLRFYHFSGFGHDFAWASHEFETFEDAGRLLKPLWEEYGRALEANAYDLSNEWCWGHFKNGVAVTKADRALYRQTPDASLRFPNPYDIECFRWLREL
jgi:hypothetical protein